MPEKDIVSWTSLISGLVSQYSYRDALYLFKTLLSDDCQPQPNDVTVVSTMSTCASLGSMDLTKCFHALLGKAGWLELDVSVVNSLIDAYAKCGDLCCARKVFEDIENILSACAHSGLVEEGLYIFELMSTKYGIQPDLRHYGCIVDLLARAGMVYRAYNIVENMPMEPNLAVLGSLLSGCRLHNNLEFGEAVLRKIELLKDKRKFDRRKAEESGSKKMALGLILGIGRAFRRKRTSSLDILTSKRSPRGFYKGNNCKPTGFHTRKGGYVVVPEKLPKYVVPDLTDFKLKPYVSQCARQAADSAK
ncbi:pentatricopeptide repeat-containing protein At5g66520-like [Sesamum indicum]|uniref:Pentatricopeptide repeat-containing protein At5g66520-like n=1 Tax=Sesamum indicum TaxID=4182 RepID=A0A6I9UIC4_SESIN|nr:pentatricopeptide repeat-containing protein At5g66520-like [Sesamum indicum]